MNWADFAVGFFAGISFTCFAIWIIVEGDKE